MLLPVCMTQQGQFQATGHVWLHIEHGGHNPRSLGSMNDMRSCRAKAAIYSRTEHPLCESMELPRKLANGRYQAAARAIAKGAQTASMGDLQICNQMLLRVTLCLTASCSVHTRVPVCVRMSVCAYMCMCVQLCVCVCLHVTACTLPLVWRPAHQYSAAPVHPQPECCPSHSPPTGPHQTPLHRNPDTQHCLYLSHQG